MESKSWRQIRAEHTCLALAVLQFPGTTKESSAKPSFLTALCLLKTGLLNLVGFVLFVCLFVCLFETKSLSVSVSWFLKTSYLCVALAVLELTS